MRKRMIALIFMVLLLLPCVPALAQAGPDGVIEIFDRAGLERMADSPGASYRLCANIDLSGADWTPLDFSGTFDGNGYTLYNLRIREPGAVPHRTVDGNSKKYDTRLAGLFAQVDGGLIENLTIRNADVSIHTQEDCFAAILAGGIAATEIRNCSVSGRVSVYMSALMFGAGGIAGFGHGTITDCKADVTLVAVDENVAERSEEFMGAMLACGYAEILRAEVKARLFASVHGYVHNGGVVGMYRVHTEDYRVTRHIDDCTVDAEITFFEHLIGDRRGYCDAIVGEIIKYTRVELGYNFVSHFQKTETRDFSQTLLPDPCAVPNYVPELTAPSCTEFGYTTYTCTTCGYAYTDDYVAPAHTPGPWQVVTEPTPSRTGLRRRVCALCGAVTDEEELPQITSAPLPIFTPAPMLTLDAASLRLAYRSSAQLTASAGTPVSFSSSDPGIASVDASGRVLAVGRGRATITCTAADDASVACPVEVVYTWWQWLIVTVCFGFLWY